MKNIKIVFSLFIIIVILHAKTHARVSLTEVPEDLSIQGKTTRPDGLPLENSEVKFNIQALSPGAESCVLFEEGHFVNMSNI